MYAHKLQHILTAAPARGYYFILWFRTFENNFWSESGVIISYKIDTEVKFDPTLA